MWAKHIIDFFDGVFRGGQDFFDPQIVLSAAQGNFRVKKIEVSRNPLEKADYVFCRHKKITWQVREIMQFKNPLVLFRNVKSRSRENPENLENLHAFFTYVM